MEETAMSSKIPINQSFYPNDPYKIFFSIGFNSFIFHGSLMGILSTGWLVTSPFFIEK
jgi:hypothetical protein